MATPLELWIDFDGTLVVPNVARELVERFGADGVRVSGEVDTLLHTGAITLREAWEREIAILPADRLGEMAEYAVEHAPLRPGARELIDLLDRHHVRATVLSGGVDFYIAPILQRERIAWPFQ
ncbi:MAG: haloacid dehalogenase-like hydrolase, partial [Thermoplasmata archaeon]|nr:haloacid dehalogenase-like hydrolase [Thermoplasmata archaeon]